MEAKVTRIDATCFFSKSFITEQELKWDRETSQFLGNAESEDLTGNGLIVDFYFGIIDCCIQKTTIQ